MVFFAGNFDTCSEEDFACLAMAQKDRLGLEAIKQLHKQLDDDKDGTIDLSESDDVSIENSKYILIFKPPVPCSFWKKS